MADIALFGDDKWDDDIISIVVCEDHAMMRRRLVVGLESHADLEVMAEAADGAHAIALCRAFVPDLAIIGMRVEHIGGPSTAAGIREVSPNTKVVVLIAAEDETEAVLALKAGASGFVSRDGIEHTARVVRAVCAGVVALPPLVVQRVLEEYNRLALGAERAGDGVGPPVLTDRERTVLEHLAGGQTYATAGTSLGVKDFTARNLAANAIEKLARHARVEAVAYAVQERRAARGGDPRPSPVE